MSSLNKARISSASLNVKRLSFAVIAIARFDLCQHGGGLANDYRTKMIPRKRPGIPCVPATRGAAKPDKPLRTLVPVERIELPTFGLQNRCSTAELNRQKEQLQAVTDTTVS
jgi:hypothetical protein